MALRVANTPDHTPISLVLYGSLWEILIWIGYRVSPPTVQASHAASTLATINRVPAGGILSVTSRVSCDLSGREIGRRLDPGNRIVAQPNPADRALA